MKVKHFKLNNKACIYFYKRGRFSYIGITLIGTMEVLTDQKSKDEIWKEGDTLFYKQGKTDPDYCVLKFMAQKC